MSSAWRKPSGLKVVDGETDHRCLDLSEGGPLQEENVLVREPNPVLHLC